MYRQAKVRVEAMPADQRDPYLRKVWAYRHELELAGMPWAALNYVAYFLGAGLILIAGKLEEQQGPLFLAGAVVLLSSFVLQRLAAKKRLAYEQAHPFKD